MADRFDKFTERARRVTERARRVTERARRVTEQARRVLPFAQEEALRLAHNYIGTEHLLLGLVREGEGIAAGVLISLGVGLDTVRSQVLYILNQSASGPSGAWEQSTARYSEAARGAYRKRGSPRAGTSIVGSIPSTSW